MNRSEFKFHCEKLGFTYYEDDQDAVFFLKGKHTLFTFCSFRTGQITLRFYCRHLNDIEISDEAFETMTKDEIKIIAESAAKFTKDFETQEKLIKSQAVIYNKQLNFWCKNQE